MGIAVIDFILFIILLIFTIRGAVRGFISSLLSLAAIILGTLAGIFFFRRVALIMRGWFLEDVRIVPEIISFVVIFLLVFGVVKIVEITLKSIIKKIQFGGADHFLGFLFGLGEGIIIICLLLFLINIQTFVQKEGILGNSFFAKIFMPFLTGDTSFITPFMDAKGH
ncbi:MAG: CvpA family protein [Treponema sp.]|nr:CvpA family protein [Treponema sp.]